MEAKNTTETLETETLEIFRTMLEEHSVKTSSILYQGSTEPYLLAMKMENGKEVFYAYEVTSATDFRANPEKTAALFSDAEFIFRAIQTMNLPVADRCFESLSLLTRKIVVPTEEDPHEFVNFLHTIPKFLESTIVIAPVENCRISCKAVQKSSKVH